MNESGKAARISGSPRCKAGGHHVTVPDHNPIKLGTLAAILKAVAMHHKLTTDQLLQLLDL